MQNPNANISRMLTITLTIVVGLWIVVPVVVVGVFWLGSGHLPQLTPGTVGDIFGSVGALFAGLAFAGLVWTVQLQYKAINIQQAELRSQMKTMERIANHLPDASSESSSSDSVLEEIDRAGKKLMSSRNQSNSGVISGPPSFTV